MLSITSRAWDSSRLPLFLPEMMLGQGSVPIKSKLSPLPPSPLLSNHGISVRSLRSPSVEWGRATPPPPQRDRRTL